jgi:hypothetical protein
MSRSRGSYFCCDYQSRDIYSRRFDNSQTQRTCFAEAESKKKLEPHLFPPPRRAGED